MLRTLGEIDALELGRKDVRKECDIHALGISARNGVVCSIDRLCHDLRYMSAERAKKLVKNIEKFFLGMLVRADLIRKILCLLGACGLED